MSQKTLPPLSAIKPSGTSPLNKKPLPNIGKYQNLRKEQEKRNWFKNVLKQYPSASVHTNYYGTPGITTSTNINGTPTKSNKSKIVESRENMTPSLTLEHPEKNESTNWFQKAKKQFPSATVVESTRKEYNEKLNNTLSFTLSPNTTIEFSPNSSLYLGNKQWNNKEKISMCKANILDVSDKINSYSTFKVIADVDMSLKRTKLFEARIGNLRFELMSLLFLFDERQGENYVYANFYFNKGSYDPNVSTRAIEQNRESFTREQKLNKDSRTKEIKFMGNQYNSVRNSLLIRLAFLFLIKVMFYALNGIYFLELQESIEKHVILCGENLRLGPGGVYYPNNIFLKNNVNLYYQVDIDKNLYLYNVKQRFIEFLHKSLRVFTKKGEEKFSLDSIYMFLQKYPMGRDKKIKEYLQQYEILTRAF